MKILSISQSNNVQFQRKPTAKEMEEIISNPVKADEYKGNFVHVNICPYSALNDSDKNKNAAFESPQIQILYSFIRKN